jgi:hypothetical protein
MAELEYGNRDNLFNMMKAYGKGGDLLEMAQNLAETLDMVRDMPAYPATGIMEHQGARFVALPTGQVVSVGGGWTAGFADLQPYTEGMMEVHSRYQVPMTALDKIDNKGEYVGIQESAHEEGLIQGWGNTLIRGDDTQAPERITGLQNRAPWNSLAQTNYVFDVGGSSNLRSGWLMNPGKYKVHIIYPKNHDSFGIKRTPKGEVFVAASSTDANASGSRWDHITEFEYIGGINIHDQKCVKRICNIDNTLANMTTTLVRKVIQARLRHNMPGPWFLYVDYSVYTQLVIMAGEKNNVYFSPNNPYKTNLPMIGADIIVRRMDALETAETAVA